MKHTISMAILFSTGLVSSQAMADTMRCGNKLVYEGASPYQVKSICGEPDDAVHRTETRVVSEEVAQPCADVAGRSRCSKTVSTSIEVVIDEWTYDFGSNMFIRLLRFENGKLLQIRDGSYGSKKP